MTYVSCLKCHKEAARSMQEVFYANRILYRLDSAGKVVKIQEYTRRMADG